MDGIEGMEPVVRTGALPTLVDGLIEHLAARLSADPGQRLVLGVTGAPGSGKSTLVAGLGQRLTERGLLAGTVPMDGFHLSNAVLDELGRHGRKGAPDTFDVAGYLSVLDRLRAPGTPEVMAPVYRRDLHEPVAAGTRVLGTGVVLTEGNYLALEEHGWAAARERLDLLICLEVDSEELVRRLVERHIRFGRRRAAAAHWVRTVDMPNAELVARYAHRCDELWRPLP